MVSLRLYMLQRITALIMVPLVIGHIAMMIYAVQGGLSAGEILARTTGSFAWAAFYGTFVIAVAMHAAIGLRVIAVETLNWPRQPGARTLLTILIFFVLAALGLAAVAAVTAPGLFV